MNPVAQETTTIKPIDQLAHYQLAEATTRKLQGTIVGATGVILGALSFFPIEPIARFVMSVSGVITAIAGYNIRKSAADQIGLLTHSAA